MSRARRVFVAAVAVTAVAASAPAAHAGLLVESATDCEAQSASQVFLPWADVANYVAAPGAQAESAAGWSLDGARVVQGNEPWHVVDANDSKSLELTAGDTATTDTMCVGITHPTLRYFVKQNAGAVGSYLRTDVIFEGADGEIHTLPIGAAGGAGWHPTAPQVVSASLLPLLPGSMTPVRFRFTAVGGAFQVDDVHVDPWGRG